MQWTEIKTMTRTKIAYDNMTLGNGIEASSADEAIKALMQQE